MPIADVQSSAVDGHLAAQDAVGPGGIDGAAIQFHGGAFLLEDGIKDVILTAVDVHGAAGHTEVAGSRHFAVLIVLVADLQAAAIARGGEIDLAAGKIQAAAPGGDADEIAAGSHFSVGGGHGDIQLAAGDIGDAAPKNFQAGVVAVRNGVHILVLLRLFVPLKNIGQAIVAQGHDIHGAAGLGIGAGNYLSAFVPAIIHLEIRGIQGAAADRQAVIAIDAAVAAGGVVSKEVRLVQERTVTLGSLGHQGGQGGAVLQGNIRIVSVQRIQMGRPAAQVTVFIPAVFQALAGDFHGDIDAVCKGHTAAVHPHGRIVERMTLPIQIVGAVGGLDIQGAFAGEGDVQITAEAHCGPHIGNEAVLTDQLDGQIAVGQIIEMGILGFIIAVVGNVDGFTMIIFHGQLVSSQIIGQALGQAVKQLVFPDLVAPLILFTGFPAMIPQHLILFCEQFIGLIVKEHPGRALQLHTGEVDVGVPGLLPVLVRIIHNLHSQGDAQQILVHHPVQTRVGQSQLVEVGVALHLSNVHIVCRAVIIDKHILNGKATPVQAQVDAVLLKGVNLHGAAAVPGLVAHFRSVVEAQLSAAGPDFHGNPGAVHHIVDFHSLIPGIVICGNAAEVFAVLLALGDVADGADGDMIAALHPDGGLHHAVLGIIPVVQVENQEEGVAGGNAHALAVVIFLLKKALAPVIQPAKGQIGRCGGQVRLKSETADGGHFFIIFACGIHTDADPQALPPAQCLHSTLGYTDPLHIYIVRILQRDPILAVILHLEITAAGPVVAGKAYIQLIFRALRQIHRVGIDNAGIVAHFEGAIGRQFVPVRQDSHAAHRAAFQEGTQYLDLLIPGVGGDTIEVIRVFLTGRGILGDLLKGQVSPGRLHADGTLGIIPDGIIPPVQIVDLIHLLTGHYAEGVGHFLITILRLTPALAVMAQPTEGQVRIMGLGGGRVDPHSIDPSFRGFNGLP